ncbi:MAG: hypothetical protein OXG83_04210 [Acidobacteria bacterium]|nr:hypothetical protein [Acidobacteriota bacterium]
MKAQVKKLLARFGQAKKHPIYGNATAEQVALKLRRTIAEPARTETKKAG